MLNNNYTGISNSVVVPLPSAFVLLRLVYSYRIAQKSPFLVRKSIDGSIGHQLQTKALNGSITREIVNYSLLVLTVSIRIQHKLCMS